MTDIGALIAAEFSPADILTATQGPLLPLAALALVFGLGPMIAKKVIRLARSVAR